MGPGVVHIWLTMKINISLGAENSAIYQLFLFCEDIYFT